MNAKDVIDLENRYVLQTYGRSDFVFERGEGVHLYDTEGREYLDFVAGIAVNALGYGDSEVLAAIQEQSHKLIHVSNLYQTIPQANLAQMLVEGSFADRVFFCNSGTEAIEAALKFARKCTLSRYGQHKYQIVAFRGSFHGRTLGALATTAKEKYRKPFGPLMPGVEFVDFNDAAAARKAIGPQTCAVIVEPIQGEGGVNVGTKEFLQALRQACDANNAVLIFDEVQCGLGRTGYLWAHEHYCVTPDIMALAKPLGGGLPMGATLVTREVAENIERGDHGSTFAANCLVAAVAQVVVRRISDPAFLAHVRETGEYLGRRLNALRASHPSLVTEVRGRGLIWGIDTPLAALDVVKTGYNQGLVVAVAGDHVVRLVPPLIVEREHCDQAIAKLEDTLQAVASDQKPA